MTSETVPQFSARLRDHLRMVPEGDKSSNRSAKAGDLNQVSKLFH